MADEWVTTTIGEIAAPIRNALVGGPFGSNLVSSDYVSDGCPVIRGQNMGRRWVGGEFVYVDAPKAESLSANKARPLDLVFTQRGTLGQVSLVPDGAFSEYIVSQSQMKLTVDPRKANPYFVYYVFSSSEYQDYIRQNAVQTGVPHINLGILRSMALDLPLLPEQRAIAGVLGAIDDKIEVNRRMAETLEEMARALFRSWFVDFDPVRAKAEGRDTGLPSEIADLFPDRLVDSNLGEIPDGWRSAPLSELCALNPSRPLKRGQPVPYLDMASMPTRGHAPGPLAMREAGSGARFVNGDTLVARITPCLENGKTAFVDFLNDGEVGWGSTEYVVLRPLDPIPLEYGYLLARSDEFRDFAVQRMSGSSGRQRVSAEALGQFRVAHPSEQVAAAFGRIVHPIMAAAGDAVRSNEALTELRDALLPKLVSGEVRIADPVGFVERLEAVG